MKAFIRALSGKPCETPPFWLMRQAGRYLPEYRELRTKAGSFLDLVYTPALAAEAAMQPLRRFGMDAAIVFSDILTIPQALGRSLTFEEGEGPRLNPLGRGDPMPLMIETHFAKTMAPVYEAVAATKSSMQAESFGDRALIGFAGGPWTLACYIVEGRGGGDFMSARRWAYEDPGSFGHLVDVLTKAVISSLEGQIRAGAEAVQIFDSWAGIMDESQFRRWVIEPTRAITAALRQDYPQIPVIGFPRGAGAGVQAYCRDSGVTAVSLDHTMPLRWARSVLQPMMPVQGNLDPVALLAGGDALHMAAEHVLSGLSSGPFVFNLGHGVHKDTPPDHVGDLARQIREWKA